jgi:hypothetical protein
VKGRARAGLVAEIAGRGALIAMTTKAHQHSGQSGDVTRQVKQNMLPSPCLLSAQGVTPRYVLIDAPCEPAPRTRIVNAKYRNPPAKTTCSAVLGTMPDSRAMTFSA